MRADIIAILIILTAAIFTSAQFSIIPPQDSCTYDTKYETCRGTCINSKETCQLTGKRDCGCAYPTTTSTLETRCSSLKVASSQRECDTATCDLGKCTYNERSGYGYCGCVTTTLKPTTTTTLVSMRTPTTCNSITYAKSEKDCSGAICSKGQCQYVEGKGFGYCTCKETVVSSTTTTTTIKQDLTVKPLTAADLLTKYTFTITTTDPVEAKRLAKALDMARALFEITYNLKKRTEWAIENVKDPFEAHEKIFEEIYSVLEQHNIDIDDIIE